MNDDEKCSDCGKNMSLCEADKWICSYCCEHKVVSVERFHEQSWICCVRCGSCDVYERDYNLIFHKKDKSKSRKI